MEGEDMEALTKEELVNRLRSAHAHIQQLKNIINKNTAGDLKKQTSQKQFDFTKCQFRHILLKFYYLGWDYHGYATQEDTENTIEYHIFKALMKTCLIKNRESSNYHRCGRTDKGVSAFAQTISIDVRSRLSKDDQEHLEHEIDYCNVLNKVLPEDIQCYAWCPVEQNYSARFNCSSRTYKYFFPKGDVDVNEMRVAADFLTGTHDYRNFCKMDIANGVVEFVRRIDEIKITPLESNSKEELYVVTVKGSGFLWHQIRCIMGVLFLIGQQREKPDVVKELLNVNKNPRKPDYNLSSAIPLNLYACEYETANKWQYSEHNLNSVIKKLQHTWTHYASKTSMLTAMLKSLEDLQTELVCKPVDHNFAECLLESTKSRKYVPLMQRQKCESLEDRIKHLSKRRKLEQPKRSSTV